MKFRHELKTEINRADYLALRSRLRVIMSIDSHAADGKYFVRSLTDVKNSVYVTITSIRTFYVWKKRVN